MARDIEQQLVNRVPISCCITMAAAVDDTLVMVKSDDRYTIPWPLDAGGGYVQLSYCPFCGCDLPEHVAALSDAPNSEHAEPEYVGPGVGHPNECSMCHGTGGSGGCFPCHKCEGSGITELNDSRPVGKDRADSLPSEAAKESREHGLSDCGHEGSLGHTCNLPAGHRGDHQERRVGKGLVGWANHEERFRPCGFCGAGTERRICKSADQCKEPARLEGRFAHITDQDEIRQIVGDIPEGSGFQKTKIPCPECGHFTGSHIKGEGCCRKGCDCKREDGLEASTKTPCPDCGHFQGAHLTGESDTDRYQRSLDRV